MRRWILAAILALCAQSAWAASPTAAPPPAAPAIGETPPPALGKDGKGKAINLADYRGKVVIVTFWASWCGYCLKELPALNALQTGAGEQWLKIIAVNVQDEMPQYRAMLRQMRDYTLVMTRDRDGDIAATYGVKAYPNLWMINPQGKVAVHHVGYGESSLQEIINEIKRLLYVEMERQKTAAAG
ncbi:MAG: TlpA family protein disulfide reductase [Lysobacter sp.]|nr:TlpA family protein disulfide reductase [Lysobacter sp.]